MIDTRVLTHTPTQANLLRLILNLHKTSTILRDGKPYLAIQLDKMASMVGLKARSSVSRALNWLEAQGIIQIIRDRWNRSPRLYIRPLIKTRATSNERQTNVTRCADATSCLKPSEKLKTSNTAAPSGTAGITVDTSIPENSGRLRGNLAGAADRIKEKKDTARAHVRDQQPKPKIVAHAWVRILGEYGYLGFDPNDGKHLKHISKTLSLFDSPNVGAFEVELERRISAWQEHRPKALGKAAPHPWAINRTDPLFQKLATVQDDEDYTIPGMAPLIPDAIIQSPPAVDELKTGSQNGPDVVTPPKKGGMMHLFKKGKDAK